MRKISFCYRLLEYIAPRFCLVCKRRLAPTEQIICAACNAHMPRTAFQYHAADNTLVRLFWGIIPIERAAALFFYQAHSATAAILYDLKYHDQSDIGTEMGRMMAREFSETEFFNHIDIIIPVPLARKRQRQRGYNQSQELAKGISSITHIPVENKVVRRNRFEKSQTNMKLWERQENVKDVFELMRPEAIRGKHVLLVDDVITTGATMTSCGQELLKAGNVKLSLLSLAFAKN
jgi:ComF family protein